MNYFLWSEAEGFLPELVQEFDSIRTAELLCRSLNTVNQQCDSAAIWFVTSAAGEVLA
jgi:hypothetical protein